MYFTILNLACWFAGASMQRWNTNKSIRGTGRRSVFYYLALKFGYGLSRASSTYSWFEVNESSTNCPLVPLT